VAKKVRDKEPVLDIIVGTGGRHSKFSPCWRTNHIRV